MCLHQQAQSPGRRRRNLHLCRCRCRCCCGWSDGTRRRLGAAWALLLHWQRWRAPGRAWRVPRYAQLRWAEAGARRWQRRPPWRPASAAAARPRCRCYRYHCAFRPLQSPLCCPFRRRRQRSPQSAEDCLQGCDRRCCQPGRPCLSPVRGAQRVRGLFRRCQLRMVGMRVKSERYDARRMRQWA